MINNLKAPKNGYVYIYVSNENDDAVYFDNFTVSDTRGRIIEEEHYYAFGLKIAGISSVKLGDLNEGMLDNKNLYNDKEIFDDADLNWYDYGFRNYDAQIGRFTQLDPLTDEYPELTPYQYASDEPIANVDMDGLESYQSLTPVVVQGLSRTAPAATNAGVNIFKISTRIIPTLTNIAAIHSEQSSVSRQLQANMQAQFYGSSTGQNATVSSCCSYFVSDLQKSINATNTSDAGFNPDGSLNFLGRLSQNKTLNNFANNIVFSPAVDIAGAAVGIGELSEGLRAAKAASTFFEGASYSSKVLRQMRKVGDIYHAFPKSVDGFATKFGKVITRVGGDGKSYQVLEMQGSYSGKSGVFEYIKNASGEINHRFFKVP